MLTYMLAFKVAEACSLPVWCCHKSKHTPPPPLFFFKLQVQLINKSSKWEMRWRTSGPLQVHIINYTILKWSELNSLNPNLQIVFNLTSKTLVRLRVWVNEFQQRQFVVHFISIITSLIHFPTCSLLLNLSYRKKILVFNFAHRC